MTLLFMVSENKNGFLKNWHPALETANPGLLFLFLTLTTHAFHELEAFTCLLSHTEGALVSLFDDFPRNYPT